MRLADPKKYQEKWQENGMNLILESRGQNRIL
jgi:hypothetical protein